MSQAGYTPIQLYYSTTAAAVPVNTNLANGELAINITDGKLYYKDNTGTVKLLASNATSAPVLSFSAGTTGFTPSTATSGAITLAGTLATTNGGTGLTSFTSGGVVYASSTSALATGSALTFDGTNLGVSGNANFGNSGSSSYGGYATGGRIFSLAATGGVIPAISASTDTFTASTAIRAYTKEVANDTSYAFDIQTGNGSGVTTQKLQLTWGANGLWNSTALSVTGNINSTNTIKSGSGSGETLTTGSVDVGKDIGLADGQGIVTGGSRLITVKTAGYVGIGATNPTVRLETKIAANGVPATSGTTQTNGAFRVSSSGTTGILDFGPNGSSPWIQATDSTDLSQKYNLLLNPNGGNVNIGVGNLLVGTTSLRTTGYTTGVSQYAMENIGYGGAQWFTNRTDSIGSFIVLGKSRGTVVNSNTIVANGDELGALVFQGTTGSGVASAAFVYGKVDGATISASSMPGRLEFFTTASGSTAPTERLRIASTGAFGLSGANYGTSGQVLTSGGSGAAPTWTTVGGGGGSPATPTVEGTVYGKMVSSATATTGLGYNVLVNNTGNRNTAVGRLAAQATGAGSDLTAIGNEALSSNTSGNYNVAVGGNDAATFSPLTSNTTGSYNIAVGNGALGKNTTASDNTAVGYQAGYSNTTGTELVAVGKGALYANTTGNSSTAVGRISLNANTTGDDNAALGNAALNANTTGGFNTALGSQSLISNTTASNNVAVGYRALYTNTTGGRNTAIGYLAGNVNVSTANNVYVGAYAGAKATGTANTAVGDNAHGNASSSGSYNCSFGQGALANNTDGYNNVAIGFNALLVASTAANNTAVGYIAGDSITTGGANTLLGLYAATSITTGAHNIAIGYESALNHTTGSQNIFLGRETRGSTANASQQFVIGFNVIGQGDDTITVGDSGGKIYNSYKVNATWTQTSDGRLKKNIQEDALGLSFINRLRAVTYEWKASNELEQDSPYYAEVNNRTTGVVMHGLVAQEVKAALDAEGVSTFAGWDVGSDGVQSISREMFISPLIKAIQELSAQVETLKSEIALLKGA